MSGTLEQVLEELRRARKISADTGVMGRRLRNTQNMAPTAFILQGLVGSIQANGGYAEIDAVNRATLLWARCVRELFCARALCRAWATSS
jgi:hypothetical protein